MSERRSCLSLSEWRRRSAASLLAIWLVVPTQISFAQSAPLAALTSLSLNKSEQENLAAYIRACEVEKDVSEMRAMQLTTCNAPYRPDLFEFWPSIVLVLISGTVGFAIGAHQR